MNAQAPIEEVLADVPLSRLPELPPDSVAPEVYVRRATQAERKASKLYRELMAERAQRRQLERDLEMLASQAEVIDLLDESAQDSYDTYEIKESYSGGAASALFVLTDWHCEEKVDPSTINGLNEYSPEIAAKRVNRCVERFLALLDSVRSLSRIEHVVIPILGDLINGYIHEEFLEENYLSPTEALVFVRDKLHEVIDTVVKESGVERVDIYTAPGNHGRTTKQPRVATANKNSYEWLLYQWMAKDYSSTPKVAWHVSNGYFNMADIQGKRVRFHHGDGISYQGGVNGIGVPVMKSIWKWDGSVRADLDVFGHWHQFLVQPKFVSCNCLIGYNSYAQKVVKAPFSHPSQTFIVIDKNRPGAVDVREVFCD
jgi:hypothetical protein